MHANVDFNRPTGRNKSIISVIRDSRVSVYGIPSADVRAVMLRHRVMWMRILNEVVLNARRRLLYATKLGRMLRHTSERKVFRRSEKISII